MATNETRSDNSSEELEQKESWSTIFLLDPAAEDVQDVQSSSVVTSDGGSVSVNGIKLTCPTEAVDDPVTIKLKLEEPDTQCGLIVHHGLENDVIFGAPIINCQPNGQMFKKHVTLTVALDRKIGKSTDALLVLHGAPTNDGKIFWEDITHNSHFDLEKEELQVEINQFSLIAVLLRLTRSTWVQTKAIITRLNFISFKYTLSVLFKSNHQHSPFDELALVFMSQDSYQEPLYREHEDSALMQLISDGFEELGSNVEQESGYIYNRESLTVSIQLGEDYKPVNSQQERIEYTVHVESSVWWSTGHIIRMSLQGSSDDAKILCGRVVVHGQHGHVLEECFSVLCHGYVRCLLGVENVIFNIKPVAQKLGLPEETLNHVVACWQSEAKQLEIVLRWWESQGNTEDHAMLRKALEGLEPEEYTVKERGQMHIKHLREAAVTIVGLPHNYFYTMKYLGHKIKTLCSSVLKDCCIEINLPTSTENCADVLEIHSRISEDVAKKYKQMQSSHEDYIPGNFLVIVPRLIQPIKEIFRDKRIPQAQNGLRGVAEATLDKIALDIQEAAQSKNTSRLFCEVSTILENLCLKNNNNRSTEDEICGWGHSLSIITMLHFLENFFQSSEAQRLYRRLVVLSVSFQEFHSNPATFEGSFLRDLHNVALSLLQFAKFDPSQLVRFELIHPTNSSSGRQGYPSPGPSCLLAHSIQANDVKYDKLNETYSQMFWISKEFEDELQLKAVALVHINGRTHSIGPRNVRCPKAGTVVGLRLSHKWRSKTIIIDLEDDFVTHADPTAKGACVPDPEIAGASDSSSASTENEERSLSPVETQTSRERPVKQGKPDKDELEGLASQLTEVWKVLGRRLEVDEARLDAFHRQDDQFSEKAYKMLLYWKQRDGSAATYQVLYDALCHSLVSHKKLAEEYCCDR